MGLESMGVRGCIWIHNKLYDRSYGPSQSSKACRRSILGHSQCSIVIYQDMFKVQATLSQGQLVQDTLPWWSNVYWVQLPVMEERVVFDWVTLFANGSLRDLSAFHGSTMNQEAKINYSYGADGIIAMFTFYDPVIIHNAILRHVRA